MKILPGSLILLLIVLQTATPSFSLERFRCVPTPPDAEGPFYRAGAPVRNKVGEGYVLSGMVKSAADCLPIAGAKLEIWMNGPDGRYGDSWRATLYSGPDGRYRFESHFPVPYGSRPPHIHIAVNADRFSELITQHYPVQGTKRATFDLVMKPAP